MGMDTRKKSRGFEIFGNNLWTWSGCGADCECRADAESMNQAQKLVGKQSCGNQSANHSLN